MNTLVFKEFNKNIIFKIEYPFTSFIPVPRKGNLVISPKNKNYLVIQEPLYGYSGEDGACTILIILISVEEG